MNAVNGPGTHGPTNGAVANIHAPRVGASGPISTPTPAPVDAAVRPPHYHAQLVAARAQYHPAGAYSINHTQQGQHPPAASARLSNASSPVLSRPNPGATPAQGNSFQPAQPVHAAHSTYSLYGTYRPISAEAWRGMGTAGQRVDVGKLNGTTPSERVNVSSDAESNIKNGTARGGSSVSSVEKPLVPAVVPSPRIDYPGATRSQEMGVMPRPTPT